MNMGGNKKAPRRAIERMVHEFDTRQDQGPLGVWGCVLEVIWVEIRRTICAGLEDGRKRLLELDGG